MKELTKTPHKWLLSLILLTSCSTEREEVNLNITTFSSNVMTMDYRIHIGHKTTDVEQKKIQSVIQEVFQEVDNIYNKWNPKSELSSLNRLKKNVKVKISKQLEKLLLETDKIYLLSDGKFDPTIEPLQKLWKEHFSKGNKPEEHEIQEVMKNIGWKYIHVKDGFFYKDSDETMIDLGGIAKGYAIDLLVDKLKNLNYDNLFVEWGGEIRTTGKHPEGRDWHIYISRLQNNDPNEAIAHIDLKNQAIATSGDYLQNWTIKENNKLKSYFHIFDSKTGKPLEITFDSIASTSVIANSCLLADALATTLMLFQNQQQASEWIEKVKLDYPEIQYWIVSRGTK